VKPENLVGTRIGRYQLEALIGTGGVAAVYRALDTFTRGRRLAIKILFPPPGAGPTLGERFRREAHTAAQLDHPGILRVFDVGEADGHLFIAMELVEGASLQALLEARGQFDEATAAEVGAQVAGALHYAHTQGVIHRDVKPSNILIDPQGRALLADFGVARALDDPSLTTTGLTVGTPAYMSPEQASGRADIDGRADLYSLGVVLYQMVTGRPPFQGGTPQVMHAHVYQPPPLPSSVAAVSPAMEAIILRVLSKNPDDRYPSGAALAADLWPLVETTRTHQPAALRIGPLARRRRFRWLDTRRAPGGWAAALLAVVLTVIVIGAGMWLVVGGPSPASPPSPTGGAPVAAASPVTAMPRLSQLPSFSPSTQTGTSPGPQVSSSAGSTPGSSTASPTPTLPPTPSASPTSSPSPSPPLPTSTPPPTPTACPQPVGIVFADWLASDAGLAAQVGCPRSPVVQAAGAWESFEGGQVLWRGDLHQIYALHQDGAWRVYDDNWRDGDLVWDASIVPPAGFYQPVRGFGLVWREEAGVRDILGWATAEESSFGATFQPFERALLIADDTTARLWALLSDGTWLAGP
jgi:serine/threonine protein kinase